MLFTLYEKIYNCNMNHQETIKKWSGKTYSETPKLGAQCCAWVKKYCEERGYPITSFWWSAIQGWKSWSPFSKEWKRIEYVSPLVPSEWDLIFWSEKRCKNGHVALASKVQNPELIRCWDQNGTWKWDKIQPRYYTTKNILWWYHKI